MEHDLKRLLAYHSIENIGIILMAFGSALLFRSFGHPQLGAFLALPRSEQAEHAQEVSLSMRSAMAILAAACVLLGMGATWFLPVLDPITSQAFGIAASKDLVGGNGLLLAAGSVAKGSVFPPW
jgi:hydrogenase-4 component B